MTTTEAERFAVVVIGGGPAGLTLANLLGRYGVRTLVVEKNTTTVQEPRAVSIDDESLRTMQAAGLADEVMQDVVAGYGSHYLSPGRQCFARVEPTGTPYGFPRRNAFRQPVLEATLHRALARFANVSTLHGWRLVHHEQARDGVTVRLAGPSGETRDVVCDRLVGCDGAASTVREQLGIRLDGSTFDQRWLVVDLEDHDNEDRHTDVFCDRRRPGIALPGPHRTRRYEFRLLPGEADEDLLQEDAVRRLLDDHGACSRATIRRKVVYRFHARAASRWSVGRVFLAGDAAHLTPPFAGQGMNSGLRDVLNLAWKLAAVDAGRAGPALLDSYERERKPHAWQMIRLALQMGFVMSPPSALAGWLTRVGFRTLEIWPSAQQFVLQMKYKPVPDVRSGFAVAAKSAPALVGKLLPQPRVRTADGRVVLLDDCLGPGFALVAFTADPQAAFAQLDPTLLKRIEAVRIAVLPLTMPVPAQSDLTCVQVCDGSIDDIFRACRKHVLLVRPDRFVAAAIDLRRPVDGIAAIDQLFADTWR